MPFVEASRFVTGPSYENDGFSVVSLSLTIDEDANASLTLVLVENSPVEVHVRDKGAAPGYQHMCLRYPDESVCRSLLCLNLVSDQGKATSSSQVRFCLIVGASPTGTRKPIPQKLYLETQLSPQTLPSKRVPNSASKATPRYWIRLCVDENV